MSTSEIKALLKACKYRKPAITKKRASFTMRRPTAARDEAIILLLLDTGVRAAEFCALSIEDLDLMSGKLQIKHGVKGGAKGGGGRSVYLGKVSKKALWRYLEKHPYREDSEAPLFLSYRNGRMTPNSLRHLIKSLAGKMGIEKCHPHRFRHTFAISYLRSGGDVFTLQAILGHKSLEMTKHYARIAEVDLAEAHRKASPVDNIWLK
jgi:integrase/recombinase XerD